MTEFITVTLLSGQRVRIDVDRIGFVMGASPDDRKEFLDQYPGSNAGIQIDNDPYPYRHLVRVRETSTEIAAMCND